MSDEIIVGLMRDGIFRSNQIVPSPATNARKLGIGMDDATQYALAALLRLRQEGFDVVRAII